MNSHYRYESIILSILKLSKVRYVESQGKIYFLGYIIDSRIEHDKFNDGIEHLNDMRSNQMERYAIREMQFYHMERDMIREMIDKYKKKMWFIVFALKNIECTINDTNSVIMRTLCELP